MVNINNGGKRIEIHEIHLPRFRVEQRAKQLSTSDFQSDFGEVFGEIGGEVPAKFGRRCSSFSCWRKSSEAFSTKTPPQISPSNFTTRLWVVAGPKQCPNPERSAVRILGALQRQAVLQGAFVRIGDFTKFKAFLLDVLESRRS